MKISLDIFEMNTIVNELVKELDDIKLLIFRRFQVNIKKIKCPLQLWQKDEKNLFIYF
jgi:hypothetical protein